MPHVTHAAVEAFSMIALGGVSAKTCIALVCKAFAVCGP